MGWRGGRQRKCRIIHGEERQRRVTIESAVRTLQRAVADPRADNRRSQAPSPGRPEGEEDVGPTLDAVAGECGDQAAKRVREVPEGGLPQPIVPGGVATVVNQATRDEPAVRF